MADSKIVELYYDVISPYSYIAFEILTRYSKKWTNMDLKLRPAYLRDVIIKAGNVSPGSVPTKVMYMASDLTRLSKLYNIPFGIPKDIDDVMSVKGSEKAQRMLAVIGEKYPQYLDTVTRQIYLKIWCRDEDISKDDSLAAACDAAAIPSDVASEVVKLANEESSAKSLQNNTKDALEKGIFGMPAMVLHSDDKLDLFFGQDRIFLLAHFLGEQMQL